MTDKDLYLSWFNDFLSFDYFVEYYQYANGGTPEKPFLTMERWKKIHAFYTNINHVITGRLPEYIEGVSDE